MVDLVHRGVFHDVLDALLLGDLVQFVSVGRVGVLLCGDCEEQLLLEVMD